MLPLLIQQSLLPTENGLGTSVNGPMATPIKSCVPYSCAGATIIERIELQSNSEDIPMCDVDDSYCRVFQWAIPVVWKLGDIAGPPGFHSAASPPHHILI